MKFNVDKELKTPVYLQIANSIKEQIMAGEVADGTVLPSERTLAKLLDVHRNTIVRAYNELKAEDFINSKQGVGYIVTINNEEDYDKPCNKIEDTRKTKKVNWINQIRDEYFDLEVTFDNLFQRTREKNICAMGGGVSSDEIYDQRKVANDIAEIIAGDGKNHYFFCPYKGDKLLRQKAVSFLSTKGIKASTGQIQILQETNQAVEFISTLILKKGDTVIMEEPVHPDIFRAFELAGAKIVTIPMDEEGMKCDILADIVEKVRPRFIYVNSSFHDPTGVVLSMERRKRIMEISNEYRVPIIEEDAASELYFTEEKLPPIKSMDTTGNVIYIYSFSLNFLPGMSLALVVADRELIKRFSYIVSVRMIPTDWISQKLLARYLDNGFQYEAFDAFRENYREKQNLVCKLLDEMAYLGVEYIKPKGGVYIWCKLPHGIDCKEFINKAYNKGLSLIPGHIFYPLKNGGRDHVRINYSFEALQGLERGMNIFKETILESLVQKK